MAAVKFLRIVLTLIFVVLAGGFVAAALVRYSPGFDVDENAWNPKISASTIAAIHDRKERENRLPVFYLKYLRSALHGDFGESESLKTPVAELLRERAPVSIGLVGYGTAGGMLLGAAAAWLAVWPRRAGLRFTAILGSGFLLAIPPAVLALGFFFARMPLAIAVALALLPRVFTTLRTLLDDLHASPSLLAARTRGVKPLALALNYVLRPAVPQLIALTGVGLVLSFGTIIPIEALCDVPGIGQLAWKAALARDLPLLCALALIVTFVVAFVNSMGELAE